MLKERGFKTVAFIQAVDTDENPILPDDEYRAFQQRVIAQLRQPTPLYVVFVSGNAANQHLVKYRYIVVDPFGRERYAKTTMKHFIPKELI
jgi:hypothetical protein